MTSIVIAAHNEAAVVGRCLDALLAEAEPGEFDITVVANGCTDATAKVASARPGVRVLDLPSPGKVAALNAGDTVAVGYPGSTSTPTSSSRPAASGPCVTHSP